MPSSMTHTYLGLDVYERLPIRCQSKIKDHLEYFKLFCQGSDPFMFYHFFVGKKAKKVSDIQSLMHHTYTRDFFINTVYSIYQHKFLYHQDVMAYLYGYICHYFLDLYVHPFIYYKTGKFNKNDKNSYRYNGLHQEYEYNIDLYLIKLREKIKPYQFKIYKEIFDVSDFTDNLNEVIKESIEKTYQLNNIPKLYKKSVFYMKYFFRIFNYDPLGVKLKIYQFLDKVKPKSWIRLEELSYHHQFEHDLSFLNLDHQSWYYPNDKSVVYTSSFFDLYQLAIDDAAKTIVMVTDMLEKDTFDVKLLNRLFLDLSFSTGRPWND